MPQPPQQPDPGASYAGPQFPIPGQPGQVIPNPYYTQAFAPPPPVKRKSKRAIWISTAVVVVLALAGAGIYVLNSGRSGNSVVAKVTCQPANLAGCLIKEPAGAIQLTDTNTTTNSWDQATTATADLYQSAIAHDAAGVNTDTTTILSADVLHKIVHTDWNAVDGNNVDLVVLQFGTQKGAQDWNSTRTAEILAAYRGQAVTIPGDSTNKAYAATKLDTQGNIDAAYSAVVGDLVLNVAYSSPKQLSSADLAAWAGTELASLHTAPAPAADPAAVLETEQIGCAGNLGACLMPTPSGGQHWTDPINKHWISAATLSVNQYVQLEWDGASASDQSSVEGDFASDGITGIAHRDWDMNSSSRTAVKQADIYLLQTITAAGAGKLAERYFGEPDWGTGVTAVPFAVPGESGAQAWYSSKKDSEGLTDYYVTQTIGNVIVDASMFFYGSFDSSTAAKWTQAELNLVSQSASTQPMGQFPLTAPTLPAVGQTACAASGDCLLPLPAGATDTTSSSYYVSQDIDAGSYADQTESGGSSNAEDVATWLKSDGFSSGEHRSWSTSGGATADAVLLKYGSPAQAKAAALFEYAANAAPDRVCTDPAVPDSLCLASEVDTTDYLQKETIRVLAWKGDYEVSVSVTLSNGADLTDAYAAVQQQLAMLPAS